MTRSDSLNQSKVTWFLVVRLPSAKLRQPPVALTRFDKLLIYTIVIGDVADDVRRELLGVDADAHPGKDFPARLEIAVECTIRHIGHCCQLGLGIVFK